MTYISGAAAPIVQSKNRGKRRMDCNLYIYRVKTPEPVKITNYRPLSINHACLSLMPHVWAWDARTVGLAIDGSVPQPMERSRKKIGIAWKVGSTVLSALFWDVVWLYTQFIRIISCLYPTSVGDYKVGIYQKMRWRN